MHSLSNKDQVQGKLRHFCPPVPINPLLLKSSRGSLMSSKTQSQRNLYPTNDFEMPSQFKKNSVKTPRAGMPIFPNSCSTNHPPKFNIPRTQTMPHLIPHSNKNDNDYFINKVKNYEALNSKDDGLKNEWNVDMNSSIKPSLRQSKEFKRTPKRVSFNELDDVRFVESFKELNKDLLNSEIHDRGLFDGCVIF